MEQLFFAVLMAHIASGFTGLLSGTAIMVLPKGGLFHRRLGRVFFWAMAGIFITSIFMSLVKANWFLLCIGFFSFYLAASGYRILYLKPLKKFTQKPGKVDHLLGISGIMAGIGMWILSGMLIKDGDIFGVVPAVFGTISISLAIRWYRMFVKPPTQKNHWVRTHAMRMSGAFTSTVTAFVVVNVQTGPSWFWWLLPTAIIIPLAIRQLRRFLGGKKLAQSLAIGSFAIGLFLLNGQPSFSQPNIGLISVKDYGENFTIKLKYTIEEKELDIQQERVLPGMQQPLLFTENGRVENGKVSGTMVLLGGQKFSMGGYASKDSLMVILFKDNPQAPSGRLVAGTSEKSLTNLKTTSQQIKDTVAKYIYNKKELETAQWKSFSKALSLYGNFLQDDWEFFAAVNREIKKLPFSHLRFTKAPYTTFVSMVNGNLQAETPATLTHPSTNTSILTITSFAGNGKNLSIFMEEVIAGGSKNLVIDLRNNPGGGAGASMQLVKHLSPESRVAGALLTNKWFDTTQRLPNADDYKLFHRFTNGTTLGLIADLGQNAGVVLEVTPDPKQFKGKLYLLTSKKTASACEPLVYAFKQNSHATIVGENTAGAMLSSGAYYLSTGFLLTLPVADYYTVSGERIEGNGVKPHVEIEAAKALDYVMEEIKKTN
jgi:uncharacterized membrane protein